jgi:hypothetical protein
MGITQDEELLSVKHRLQEVVPSMQLCSKFLPGVQGRVHGLVQPSFSAAKRRGEGGSPHMPNAHEVHVA